MNTPDPDSSLNYGAADELDPIVTESSDIDTSTDVLDSLLAADIKPEIDEERLYTNEFIQANEKASRSLFLGFLGIALLGTSLFALFVMTQPQEEEEADPLNNSDSIPVPTIPSVQPTANPRLVPPTLSPPSPVTPPISSPQSPLVFPVNPQPSLPTPTVAPSVSPVPPPPPASTTP